MSWKPIVVGVDASPEGAQAVTFASGAAKRAETSCQLVHAAYDVLASARVRENARYRQALRGDARAQIVAAIGDAVPAELLEQLVVRIGGTPGILNQEVRAIGAELIVLGGKHHSTLGRWFGGSTSVAVARTSDVPVLVTAGAPTIRRVLVAVDLSAAARLTLGAAERYAALFGAELRAVSVFEPLPVLPDVTPPPSMADYYAMSEEVLKRDIWPLIRTPGVEKMVRYGTAVETILHEATDWEADLLVVGSHGKGWVQRMLLGSVTERLLNHLPTSLLVVPVPAATAAEQNETQEAQRLQPVVAIA